MNIRLAQLNYHIANFEKNTQKIVDVLQKALSDGVDLVVFSELSICGYPADDFLERKEFIEHSREAIEHIASHCKGIAAIVGGPSINPEPRGKNLFNSAFFLSEGKITAVRHKSLLPNYDVFDEYRYFQPNKVFELIEYKNQRIAIAICEDLWDEQPVANSFAREKLYTLSPIEELAKLNPTLVINIAASPFSHTQVEIRRNIIIEKAKKFQLPFFYVNQVGANTELIFDGSSMVVNANGEVILEANPFEEQLLTINTSELYQKRQLPVNNATAIQLIHDALLLGIRDYFFKSGFTKAILGLSGGIDSAVTAALAVEALGAENVRGVLMPSQYSSDHSVSDAEQLAKNMGIRYDIIPIQPMFQEFETALHPLFEGKKPDVTEENLQARIRGMLLMAISNKFGNLLLNTSNKSEAAVGYGTLYGDMSGSISVLGDVYKTEVFKLARYINRNREIIPENSITKPPSAELRENQKDSDSLPEYDILDAILFRYIELNQSPSEIIDCGFESQIVHKTIKLVNLNEYKRFQAPPILRVTSKAFGKGRHMPLVAKYEQKA